MRRRSLAVYAIVLASFAAGSLVTARLARTGAVRADSNRVFELRIYHTVPGKAEKLETRFRGIASKLLAKHDLKVVGYWVPEDAPASGDTFIYLVAHDSREAAKKNWDAMRSDPGFPEMVKAEQVERLVEKVDATYMRPTDFSPMK